MNWSDSLDKLLPSNKKPRYISQLSEAGIVTLKDLIWILPLRVFPYPEKRSFLSAKEGQFLRSSGMVQQMRAAPGAQAKKGKMRLFNVTLNLVDHLSQDSINLKWFNAYPSLKSSLEGRDQIEFLGKVQRFKGQLEVVNPTLIEQTKAVEQFIVDYPTVNKVSGTNIRKLINLIPEFLWMDLEEEIPPHILEKRELLPLALSFKILHGLSPAEEWDKKKYHRAKKRLSYQELWREQWELLQVRKKRKETSAVKIKCAPENLENITSLFPFVLTADQKTVLDEILQDLKLGHPMARLIQGEVGSGKTAVALCSAIAVIQSGYQVAFLCPTETLARQHYKKIQELAEKTNFEAALFVGSATEKEKNELREQISSGKASLIVGTHSVFQEKVSFSSLQLAIVDEQHKFGVEQRQKLLDKGEGVHSLLLSATPIPRTLELSQYGELEVGRITMLPEGRKGIETRIVAPEDRGNYIEFLKERLEANEQVYVVVPAIKESEKQALPSLNGIADTYRSFFPEIEVGTLHGGLRPQEKQAAMKAFENGEISILVATTVVEVGIDVANATVIAIHSPERFGLSSLHQLRGRVGRGSAKGYCFLPLSKKCSEIAQKRLEDFIAINNGLELAELDLKNRGAGELIGLLQSGTKKYRLADPISMTDLVENVREDLLDLEPGPEQIQMEALDLTEALELESTSMSL